MYIYTILSIFTYPLSFKLLHILTTVNNTKINVIILNNLPITYPSNNLSSVIINTQNKTTITNLIIILLFQKPPTLHQSSPTTTHSHQPYTKNPISLPNILSIIHLIITILTNIKKISHYKLNLHFSNNK